MFLKQLPTEGLTYLTEIYNHIWNTKCFPNSWRNAIVIPISKPNRDILLPENYRPISLTSTLCKVMEKIIDKRLRWFLESSKFFCDIQSGFRRFHSTTDHLLLLESEIREAFCESQHLLMISLDIEKAYDTIRNEYIMQILKDNHINGKMFHFISNFLQNRKIQVKVNGILSENTSIRNGVPQGSVISVTLFIMAINSLAKCITLPVKACMFADDVTIFCKGKNVLTTQKYYKKLYVPF